VTRISIASVSLFLASSLLSGCVARSVNHQRGGQVAVTRVSRYLPRTSEEIETLQTWYTPASGLYKTTGWWNSANIVTVLADYARVSRSTQYNSVFANTFTSAQNTSPGFLNKFYDDEGWWALAWIDAYDDTRDPRYLSMAESIFADMAGAWDDICGGGIWWSKDKKYKNAIANELFLSVAAHLVNRTTGTTRLQYLDWGNKEWTWFQASGMINAKNLINDGLGNRRDQTVGARCTNNGGTTWSYNQGVVLGGLAELSKANRDPALPKAAHSIATAAITLLVDTDGILHDPCEPKCGADGEQFKGIFVRNLVLLNQTHPQLAYKTFVYNNADSILKNAQGMNFQLGQVWSGPFNAANAASQSSGLDVIVGAATLESKD
jgi:predicted alpha-1,6-mannanase (GH76 family)